MQARMSLDSHWAGRRPAIHRVEGSQESRQGGAVFRRRDSRADDPGGRGCFDKWIMKIEARRGGIRMSFALLTSLTVGVLVGVWAERSGLGRYPLLKDKAPPVSFQQFPAVGPRGGGEAPEVIAEILRTDPEASCTEDRAPVWAYLRQLWGRTSENDLEWLFTADEALSWLCGAAQAPAELENGLVGLAGDRKLPEALREHAMQHLGQWAQEHAVGERVWEGFRRAVEEERSGEISGVALLAVARSQFAFKEKAWLCSVASECLEANGTSATLRVAACQVAAMHKLQEVEPKVRRLLLEGPTAGERLAALRVLGELGTGETGEWLAGVPSSEAPLEEDTKGKAILRIRTRLAGATVPPR